MLRARLRDAQGQDGREGRGGRDGRDARDARDAPAPVREKPLEIVQDPNWAAGAAELFR